jgi:hypothetical protein
MWNPEDDGHGDYCVPPPSPAHEPKPERTIDYNPDHHPSFSLIHTAVVRSGTRCLRIWQVKGLGVLCAEMQSDPESGRLTCGGFSLFTKEEIGWHPNL